MVSWRQIFPKTIKEIIIIMRKTEIESRIAEIKKELECFDLDVADDEDYQALEAELADLESELADLESE